MDGAFAKKLPAQESRIRVQPSQAAVVTRLALPTWKG